MTCLVKNGESIEGNGIDGHSRNPLKNRGLRPYNDNSYYRFVASRDVKAKIKQKIVGEPQIEENASTCLEDEIICDNAMINSVTGRYKQTIEAESAAHRARRWQFSGMAAIKIIIEHMSIRSAIDKRIKQLEITK